MGEGAMVFSVVKAAGRGERRWNEKPWAEIAARALGTSAGAATASEVTEHSVGTALDARPRGRRVPGQGSSPLSLTVSYCCEGNLPARKDQKAVNSHGFWL